MKTIVSLLILLLLNEIYCQTDTTFISLKGFEGSNRNTQLLFSTKHSLSDYDNASANLYVDSTIFTYNIFDVENNKQSFITNGIETRYYPENHLQYKRIADIEFINNDPQKYIYAINSLGIDPDGRISRYDQDYVAGIIGHFDDIHISKKNPNHIFAVAGSWVLQSVDTGNTWNDFSFYFQKDPYIHYSTYSPFNESIVFGINNSYNIAKSIDSGKTFNEVTKFGEQNTETVFLFDKDEAYIYAVTNHYSFNIPNTIDGTVALSNDSGNADSWQIIQRFNNKVDFCIDDSVSGNVFISVGNSIYSSTDYGYNLTEMKELSHHANGIYKEPNKDLYATIPNALLKITQDSIEYIVTKSIKNSLNFFPLAVGNKWIYHHIGVSYDVEPHPFDYYYTQEVTKDTTDDFGKYYFKIKESSVNHNDEYWLRLDSILGKVYKNYDMNLENEFVEFDLIAQSGDEIQTNNGYIWGTVESDTLLWDELRYTKIFHLYSLLTPRMTFIQNIGVSEVIYEFDFGYAKTTLTGCVINGTIYGDTTLVDVESKSNNIPIVFSLSQNYPNPFNPTTTIKYTVPVVNANFASTTNVILKIYDVLGKEVKTLVNKQQKSGSYQVNFNASQLSSGVYYYQLKSGEFVETKKMIIVK